jgi:hypothetical protein
MEWEDVKTFFDRHPNFEEEKPGLYLFLKDADWREKYRVSIDEAEHLAKIKFLGSVNSDPHIWARELERHRGERG